MSEDKILMFLDTETSSLPTLALPVGDTGQPWAVAVAAELTDIDGNSLASFYSRIRADGRKIREDAQKIHGISSLAAARSGIPEVVALGVLVHFASQANYAIGHSVVFDKEVIEGLLIQRGKSKDLWSRPGLEWVCTMRAATPLCKIKPDKPRDDGQYKWPTLDQACIALIVGAVARSGHHNAWDDMKRAQALYFELRRRGVYEISGAPEIASEKAKVKAAS